MATKAKQFELTEDNLECLEGTDEKHRDPADPKKLIGSWDGATKDEKKKLFNIIEKNCNKHGFAAIAVKESYPDYRVFTTDCLNMAISNIKKKLRDAKKKRAESRLLSFV
jgi:hypothetical protein